MQRRVSSIRESNNPRMSRVAPKNVRLSSRIREAEEEAENENEDENEEVEIEDEDMETENDSALKDQIVDLVKAALEDGVITAEDLGFSSEEGEEDKGEGDEDFEDEDFNPMEEARKRVHAKVISENQRVRNRNKAIREAQNRIKARGIKEEEGLFLGTPAGIAGSKARASRFTGNRSARPNSRRRSF